MSSSTGQENGRRHAAGAFDVRNIIAGLIGFYGVVLVLMGLFAYGEDQRSKTGDVNANLWSGIAMILVALGFAVWTRLRPIVVEARHDDGAAPSGH